MSHGRLVYSSQLLLGAYHSPLRGGRESTCCIGSCVCGMLVSAGTHVCLTWPMHLTLLHLQATSTSRALSWGCQDAHVLAAPLWSLHCLRAAVACALPADSFVGCGESATGTVTPRDAPPSPPLAHSDEPPGGFRADGHRLQHPRTHPRACRPWRWRPPAGTVVRGPASPAWQQGAEPDPRPSPSSWTPAPPPPVWAPAQEWPTVG